MLVENSEIKETSRFLASTLHEIRTPIQTIIGTIELLQETHLDNEQNEYVRQIQFSAEVLLDLANNILDFTRVQSNEFKLETIPFDIAKVAEQVVDMISIEAFNKGVEVVTDIAEDLPPFVTGDPVRVQQIMLNLIKNAVKFTSEGYIHIELSKVGDGIKFQITDSGIGISEEKRKKLFTDYFQADISTYRKFGGTGLGLSIVKNLVSRMNGEIGVKANPYGGSIFWVILPLVEPDTPFEPLSGKKANFPPSMRILIVDNSTLAIKSLKQKLLALGIADVESAETPKEALDRIEFGEKISKPFSVVFINLLLSSVDGWYLASEIKNNPGLGKPKLYLLVPEGQMRGEAKMKLLDWFEGYLYKPVKREKLEELLSSSLRNAERGVSSDGQKIDVTPKEQEHAIKKESAQKDGVASGLKILVAEDHTVNRKLIQSFLRSFGADVFLAEDGEQAVQIIDEHPDISLVFMDIFMPIKSGVEATAEIRALGYKGIVIACTANNDANDFADYMKIGINDILVKPFKKSMIQSLIEKWNAVMQIPMATKISTLQSLPEEIKDEGAVWDVDDFLETVDGDKSFGKSLVVDFVRQTEKFLAEIDANLADTLDSERIHKLAHTIKGSAAAVSAKDMFRVARELDEKAKACKSVQDTARLEDSALHASFAEFKRIAAKAIKHW